MPTIAENGLLGYAAESWLGIVGPKGVPAEIVAKLDATTRQVLQEPDVREKLSGLGFEILSKGSSNFAQFIANDAKQWREVARQADIKPMD